MRKIYILGIFTSLTVNLFGQIGINTDKGTASLTIKESNTTENLLLRAKNTVNQDIFQVTNNGNITIYNNLKFNNDPGSKGNILTSTGSNKSPIWTNSVEKGLLLQVFNATQNEIDINEFNFTGSGSTTRFLNPTINSEIEAEIGEWDSTNREFVVIKPGIYEISVGGNFYSNNGPAPSGIYIYVFAKNNPSVPIYNVAGTKSFETISQKDIKLSNGFTVEAKAIVYSSTSIALILNKDDMIVASYSTGGVSLHTHMVPFKTFFNITYTEIPQ